MLRYGRKHGLTAKEQAILFLLAHGLRKGTIAIILGIKQSTLGAYICRLNWWLQTRTITEAVAHFKLEAYGTPLWEQLTQRWQHRLSRHNSLRPVRLGLYPRAYLFAVKLPGPRRSYAVSPLSAQAAKSSIECFTRQASRAPTPSSPTSASTGLLKIR